MSLSHSPFKFLENYDRNEFDFFWGREKEIDDTLNYLNGKKLLVVSGPVGAGKTSLIKCGLANQFLSDDWFPIIIKRHDNISFDFFTAVNNHLENKIELDPNTNLPTDTNMDFGKAIQKLFNKYFQPIYLIFDQLEELLVNNSSTALEEQEFFFKQLQKLIVTEVPVPCRILIIMREGFEADLFKFGNLCPSILSNGYQIKNLRKENMKDIIKQMFDKATQNNKIEIENIEELSDKIIEKIPPDNKNIAPANVMLFLEEIWERAHKKNNSRPILKTNLIEEKDNLEKAPERFIKNTITDLDKDFGSNVTLYALNSLITNKKTNLQLTEASIEEELKNNNVKSKKPLSDLLTELQNRRVIQKFKYFEETRYELKHDVLAPAVWQCLTDEMRAAKSIIIEKKNKVMPIPLPINTNKDVIVDEKGKNKVLPIPLLLSLLPVFFLLGYLLKKSPKCTDCEAKIKTFQELYTKIQPGKIINNEKILFIKKIDSIGTHGITTMLEDLPGFYRWDQAISKCASINTNGKKWHLPNVEELRLLYANRTVIGGLNEENYWSASSHELVPKNAYFIYSKNGAICVYSKLNSMKARCVSDF